MQAIETDPILAIAERSEAAREAAVSQAGKTLGRDEFLRLLIAQLQHQDPMSPVKDTEFVAQLATFSSLEQQMETNRRLDTLALGQASLVQSQALGLIGKDALVEAGDTVRIRNGKPDGLVYALPKPAREATLTVYGPDGAPVRVFTLEPGADGRVALDWDGKNQNGVPLPDGEYRIEVRATDLEGEPMKIALFRSLPIDGVNFGGEGLALVSGDREIPFETIVEIRAGRG